MARSGTSRNGRGAGRPRVPGHDLLRRASGCPSRRDRRRRPVRPSRVKAVGLSARDGAPAHPTPWSARRGRRRPERPAVLLPAGHPTAGCGPGPPRAPRAVAGGLPRPHGTGRLVDRATLRAVALSRAASTSRCPRRHGRALGARRRQVSGRRRPQRNRPVGQGGCDQDRTTPASVWWVGSCRTSRSSTPSRRRCSCAASCPDAPTDRGGQRLVGAQAQGVRRAARGGRRSRVHRARRRAAQARDLREVVGDGAAVAQGGLGPRGRRGRDARHADRGLPVRRWHPGVDRRPGLGAPGRHVPGLVAALRRILSTLRLGAGWSRAPASTAVGSRGNTRKPRSPTSLCQLFETKGCRARTR